MITITEALKAWKSPDGITTPLVELFDIEVDDVTTLRLVNGNPTGTGSVTYNGNIYTASSIRREDLEQTIEGAFNPLRIAISNIDGVAGGYIEQNELEGRRATITTALLPDLSPADSQVETFTMQSQVYDRQAAAVTCGHENMFSRIVPGKRFIRGRCQQNYPKRFDPLNGCNHPSDQFEDGTSQNLRVGAVTNGERKIKFGWFTLNAMRASVFDVNSDTPGYLVMESADPELDWSGSSFQAPYFYKKLSGDFDVYTRVLINNSRTGANCGILCQEAADGLDSWVLAGLGRDEGDDTELRLRSGLNGVDDAVSSWAEPTHQWVRMARVGNDFKFYSSAAENASWVLRETRTKALHTDTRIGLTIAGGGSNELLGAQFPYFRFTAGGNPTCDLTKDGINGCKAHDRLHRYLAFPGIPKR